MTLRVILSIFAIACVGWVIYLASLSPSHDRNWLEHFVPTPDAAFDEDGTVTLRYVRDWTHDDSGALSKDWMENVTIHPDEVSRVWFVIAAIGDSKYVAHSFVTFELKDGRALSFSIEARREEGEDYSPFLGLFRKYELAYTWGMERDFLGVRLFFLDFQTEIYPLKLSEKEAGAVFLAMAKATAEVAKEPRFYNTLTGNCTNLLAEAINAASPGRLPYDLSWNLPALSVGYLIDQGFIDGDAKGVKATRANAKINGFADELKEVNGSAHAFSEALRRLYFENN